MGLGEHMSDSMKMWPCADEHLPNLTQEQSYYSIDLFSISLRRG